MRYYSISLVSKIAKHYYFVQLVQFRFNNQSVTGTCSIYSQNTLQNSPPYSLIQPVILQEINKNQPASIIRKLPSGQSFINSPHPHFHVRGREATEDKWMIIRSYVRGALRITSWQKSVADLPVLVDAVVSTKFNHALLASQHFLYFFPLPHGQGSFLPVFSDLTT